MIYLLIVLGIFTLDYSLKSYIDSHHLQGADEEYFGGKLILRNYHNADGAFGLFRGRPELAKNLSGVALVCVAWEFLKSLFVRGASLMKLALSFVLGGGAGNFCDRVFKGYVTDYFSIGVQNKKIKNTVFNLSDVFILLGAALFLIARIIALFGGGRRSRRS